MKNLVRSVALMAASCLILAVAASSAMADIPAKFSPSGAIKLTSASGITVKKNGAEATTCTLGSPVNGSVSGELMSAANTSIYTVFSCPSSKQLGLSFMAGASYNTTTGAYKLTLTYSVGGTYQSPWGAYRPLSGSVAVPWTNGSGGTQSTVNFSETELGRVFGSEAKITATGSITATTSTGGLLTLTH